MAVWPLGSQFDPNAKAVRLSDGRVLLSGTEIEAGGSRMSFSDAQELIDTNSVTALALECLHTVNDALWMLMAGLSHIRTVN